MELDLSFIDNEHERQAFMFSVGVIVLSVIAVLSFVLSGGSFFFYLFAILTVALFLYMVYHVSRKPEAAPQTAGRRRSSRRS